MEKHFKKIKLSKKYNKRTKKKSYFFSINILLFRRLNKTFTFLLILIVFLIFGKIEDKVEMNKTNYIHLAVNIDNKYIYPLIVYLTSLLDNQAYSTFYIIHILTGKNIKNDTFYKINATIEKFGKNASNVTYYNMGDQFNRATHGGFISTAAYYRISLPSLLPDVDKIIYTDTDVINFKDLSEMYNIEFKDKMYFCGGLDHIGLINEIKHFGIEPDKYMNSGIMLINLKAMRNDSIEDNLRTFISSHFLNHHEQTAINVVCYKNIQILPYKYGSFAYGSFEKFVIFNNEQNEKYRFNITDLYKAFNSPTLLHYAGYTKPWDKDCENKRRVYWWYYAKKSIVYQEILEHYGFNDTYIEELIKTIPEKESLLHQTIRKNKNKLYGILKMIIGLFFLNILFHVFYFINVNIRVY